MKFDIREWRKMYDKAHQIGELLHDARPTYTEKGDYIPPVTLVSKDIQEGWEWDIENTVKKSARYLDHCGLKMPKPKWYYDRKDPKTWASHESFKYGHLLEF